ncbi:MAG: glycosyltransferase [Pyrinomonadaceae bacterium]
MKEKLRIAYFPDSLNEVNGVAMTSNRLIEYARNNNVPFLVVHSGKENSVREEGSIRFVSLKSSPLSIPMDEALRYDPIFFRHTKRAMDYVKEFAPDVIHVTGLNDVSNLGAFIAWRFRTAMIASWHTNLHEFASSRLKKRFSFLPKDSSEKLLKKIESQILHGACYYYKLPQVILAPNKELLSILTNATGRTGRIMIRGVDTETFSPKFRTVNDEVIRLGFVGRLRAEKNVQLLVEIEAALLKAGYKNFKFLIVGEGNERKFLEANMRTAEFTGFLSGKQLSNAYANMDVFVFPSETDTFGNVLQEANASGAPCIVTDKGGPKFIVKDGKTGFVAANLNEFVQNIKFLLDSPEKLAQMKQSSLLFARSRSWDSVFEKVFDAYAETKAISDSKKHSNKN